MKKHSDKSIGHPILKIKPLFLSVSVILGSISVAQAAVVNTNGAGVLNQVNGPTIVHIKGASDKGVSHNIYSQFDVDQKGVILNNSAANTNTTLGGQINGNLNLNNGNGPAKVILNEVNSNKASVLGGVIEVAGTNKAQVIVANASGITCDNCGFINTDRVTLTTGKPIVAGGDLLGYNVEKGQIIINSRLQSDSPTDIIARSAVIRGDIHAEEVNVVAGNNFVDASGKQVTKVQGVGYPTSVGVDIAAMGGMYANKITLVSTESGTGVSNKGSLVAGAGGVNIDSTGLVYNQSSRMNSSGGINIKANGLSNSSTILANGDIDIITNNSDLNNVNGQITSNAGNIKLTASRVDNRSGIINARQAMSIVTSGNINNSNGSIRTNNGDLNIKASGTIDNIYNLRNNVINVDERGIRAGNDLTINTSKLYNNNSTVSGRDVTINARDSIYNSSDSQIIAKRKVTLDAASLQNYNSLIKSTNGLTNINLSDTLTNDSYAAISSGRALNIDANIINNKGSLSASAGKSKFNAYTLNNQNGYIKGNNLDIKTTNLSNNEGLIAADSNVVINTTSLNNSRSTGFNSYASKFGVAGHSGGIYAKDGSVTIKANSANNYSGIIVDHNKDALSNGGDVNITLRNDLDNRYGTIQGANTIKLDVNKLDNSNSGLVQAGKDLTIDAFSRVDNYSGGRLTSLGTTTITSPVISNSSNGTILGSMVVLNTYNYY
ncbi:filamentous hemagglutinin N-terminal domain-containing protein [Providencia rettgeri]|nr:filamentous hemagglutinin N-terminal domain-containing protein [Providencia rettgeri]